MMTSSAAPPSSTGILVASEDAWPRKNESPQVGDLSSAIWDAAINTIGSGLKHVMGSMMKDDGSGNAKLPSPLETIGNVASGKPINIPGESGGIFVAIMSLFLIVNIFTPSLIGFVAKFWNSTISPVVRSPHGSSRSGSGFFPGDILQHVFDYFWPEEQTQTYSGWTHS